MDHRGYRHWAYVFSVFSLFAAGCGEKTGAVAGKVYLDGEPLTKSFKGKSVASYRVVFVGSAGNRQDWSAIDDDGSYAIAKAPVGPVQITIEPYSEPDELPPAARGFGFPVPPEGSAKTPSSAKQRKPLIVP